MILSDDPTAVDPETLADLRVLVTVKDDKVVYEAEADVDQLADSPFVNDPAIAHAFVHAVYESMKVE